MQAKREKVRSRKQRSQVDEEHQGSREGKPAITAQKKVSFLWSSWALDYRDILQTAMDMWLMLLQYAIKNILD